MSLRRIGFGFVALSLLLGLTFAADPPPAGAPAGNGAAAAAPTEAPVPSGEAGTVLTSPNGCIGEAAVAEDLRRKREEIEARVQELQGREAELAAREKAMKDEFDRLAQIRSEISVTAEARKKEGDEKVAKLVEAIEIMSPKAASTLLSQVEESLAVASMGKLSTPRLAKIMNVMEPAKAARLSELLAGVTRSSRAVAPPPAAAPAAPRATAPAPAPTSLPLKAASTSSSPIYPRKGGEKEYGSEEQSQQRRESAARGSGQIG